VRTFCKLQSSFDDILLQSWSVTYITDDATFGGGATDISVLSYSKIMSYAASISYPRLLSVETNVVSQILLKELNLSIGRESSESIYSFSSVFDRRIRSTVHSFFNEMSTGKSILSVQLEHNEWLDVFNWDGMLVDVK